MAYLTRYSEPKLTGTIVQEKVKCGKTNCRCANGKKHGPYPYLYWREYGTECNRIVRKTYVKRDEVESLVKRIKEAKEEDKLKKCVLAEITRLLRSGYDL